MQKNGEQAGGIPHPDEGRDAANMELVQLDSFSLCFGL